LKGEYRMNQKSKEARTRLRKATRAEFESLVYEALLTPMQEKIIRLHIVEKIPVTYIAERFCMSEGTVRRNLQEVYEKVAKL
jgi:DNA-directed RNA polymerase specialized sigma24 family protein